MAANHHADIATLFAFASGTLEEPFRTVVACHLEACAQCHAVVARLEDIGGATLDDVMADNVTSRLRLETLACASRLAGETGSRIDRTAKTEGDLPRPLARRIDRPLDGIPWRPIAPRVGYWTAPEHPGDHGSLNFFRIARGGHIPEHGHGGREMTFILRGSYSDRFGRFASGDLADLDEDVEHDPVADSDMPCICVAATEAPTKFKSWLGRIVQPLVGI